MKSWFATIRDSFRSQLWPIPVTGVVLALLLGLALPRLDAAVNEHLPGWLSTMVFGGDAAAARSLLDAIASSLITVTSLTFSLTVVTLQLASSQFSPRLLRTFTTDRFVQVILGLFLATFTYALTVLRAIRNADESGQGEFVPKFAVTLAFLFAIASVIGLVLFLAHLTSQIRVETMLRNVHQDASRTLRTVLDKRDADAPRRAGEPLPPPAAVPLIADSEGFLIWVGKEALVDVAADEDVVVRLEVCPGEFIVTGTTLGSVWPAAGGSFDPEGIDRIVGRVVGCVATSFERTETQDVGYGLRQLTDVANKALSPGINDPTTAVHALGHISALLCDLTDRDLDDVLLRDAEDQVRVGLRSLDLATYVDLGLSQTRRYGAGDPQVMLRIVQVLLDLSQRVAPDQQSIVVDQLERSEAVVRAQDFDAHERSLVADLAELVRERLGE